MKKRVAVIILAIVVLLQYFCSFVFAQDNVITNNVDSNIISNDVTNSINNDLTPEEQQKLLEQKNAVSDKLNETNVKLEYVQGELSDTMIKVQEAEDKVLEYEKDIENMQTQMDALQQSINDSMARLALANLDYNQKREILANRLVAMYEAGDTEY